MSVAITIIIIMIINLHLFSVISTKKPITLYDDNTYKIYDNNT